jgi:hypothetical protein
MAEPIYGVHFSRRKEAWYALAQKEKEAVMTRLSTLATKAGAKSILNICRAMSGEWEFFGVYEYPDLSTREKLVNLQEAEDASRYFDFMLVIGKHPAGPGLGFKTE